MCDQTFVPGCSCARNQLEFDQERERVARASAIEHDVLDLLRGEHISASEEAVALHALLLRECPAAAVLVDDVLTNEDGTVLFYWVGGDQRVAHVTPAEQTAALRLVA
ncbi:hypothetical protein [Paraburkholderia sp. BR10882]|uniref:hypothetical protein n=1 Tax=unclassified Paraburkholderia TaxID=2615204 RepID=UPI0034CEA15E